MTKLRLRLRIKLIALSWHSFGTFSLMLQGDLSAARHNPSSTDQATQPSPAGPRADQQSRKHDQEHVRCCFRYFFITFM